MVTSPTAIEEGDILAQFKRKFDRESGSLIAEQGKPLSDRFKFIAGQRPGASVEELEAFEQALIVDPTRGGLGVASETKFLAGGFETVKRPTTPSRVDPRVIQARRTQQLRAFRKGAGRGVSRSGGVLSLLGGSDSGFSQPSLLGL